MKSVEHSRLEKVEFVKLSDIELRKDFEPDEIYQKLYRNLYTGKLSCAHTRIEESSITAGFYRRRDGAVEHVVDKPSRSVAWLASTIRAGSRPHLSLYWNPLSPNGGKLVCPDDQPLLAAYRSVGIRRLPVQIIGPKASSLQESALIFKGLDLKGFEGVMALQAQRIACVSGTGEDGLSEDVDHLAALCAKALVAIKAFHAEADIGVHYHQALFARVYRHKRCLDSIVRLLEIGNVDHAVVLTRILYEGFLDFYLDWLAPAQMGPVLQYVSQYESAQDSREAERPEHPRAYIGGLYDLLSNVKRKASVSSLGTAFYELAYPSLSSVAHQNYNELDLEHGGFAEQLGNSTWQRAAVVKWSNVITAEFLLRVGDEIATDLFSGAAGP